MSTTSTITRKDIKRLTECLLDNLFRKKEEHFGHFYSVMANFIFNKVVPYIDKNKHIKLNLLQEKVIEEGKKYLIYEDQIIKVYVYKCLFMFELYQCSVYFKQYKFNIMAYFDVSEGKFCPKYSLK